MTHRTQETARPSASPIRQHVLANRWKGERGCIVGPFTELSQAELFEHYVLHRNGISTPYGAVHEHGDSWYITIPA